MHHGRTSERLQSEACGVICPCMAMHKIQCADTNLFFIFFLNGLMSRL